MAGRPLSRRALLSAALVSAGVSACSRKRASRYQGWLFVASGVEKEIAVADLASFRRLASIPLPCAPDQLFQAGRRVFALCRDAQGIVEIDVENFRFKGRIALPGKPVAVRLEAGAKTALVLTDSVHALVRVDLDARRVIGRLPLPAAPADFDVNGESAAITIPAAGSILRISLPELKPTPTRVGVPCAAVRFRKDGKTIFAAAPSAREIVAIDARSGMLLTRLPLPLAPSRFCFNGDGGQMFVTGKGEDALAIVSPYQNEVDQTILAGRSPNAMAVSESRNLLFVTNSASGDLTILDIETRGVSASIHVGENPGEVLLTPDGEYALVMDQRSGNVSVVRIATVLDRKVKTKPLFTVFPTAADARSALIVPFVS
ncbi:MAG: YncE family protein [Acidobacteriota bacterium]|nr:YncE family protein [Acidobacteriota bacterium]